MDVALVIAIDVSGSVDNSEAYLQRKGVSDAFLSKDIVQAILAGNLGRIAVTSVDFSSRFYNKVIIPWRVIDDQKSATDFAAPLPQIPRTYGHGTSISDAIELGQSLLLSSPYRTMKRVIDVSGDGAEQFRPPGDPGARRGGRARHHHQWPAGDGGLRRRAIRRYGSIPPSDLDKYYAGCVIGGPGAFMQVASGFADFSRAIRHKLVLELSSNPDANSNVVKVAAQTAPQKGKPPTPQPAPPRARPTYEPGCDYAGPGLNSLTLRQAQGEGFAFAS